MGQATSAAINPSEASAPNSQFPRYPVTESKEEAGECLPPCGKVEPELQTMDSDAFTIGIDQNVKPSDASSLESKVNHMRNKNAQGKAYKLGTIKGARINESTT